MRQITAKRVRELFDYNPLTGLFTNKVGRARAKVGEIAGAPRKDGYRLVSIDYGKFLVHRVIWLWMTGKWPRHQVDHADLDRGNNIWLNLRSATPAENNANRRVRPTSKSGIKGAYFHPQTGKWRSRVQHQGVTTELGLFPSPELAGAAYLAAAHKIHGEYARGSV